MSGFGFFELLLILVVALLILGPDKLPEVARILGRGLREFRRVGDSLRSPLTDDALDAELESADPAGEDPPESVHFPPAADESSCQTPSRHG